MADESKFEQAKGNVKETVGNVTDNQSFKNEGKEIKLLVKRKNSLKMQRKQLILLIK